MHLSLSPETGVFCLWDILGWSLFSLSTLMILCQIDLDYDIINTYIHIYLLFYLFIFLLEKEFRVFVLSTRIPKSGIHLLYSLPPIFITNSFYCIT